MCCRAIETLEIKDCFRLNTHIVIRFNIPADNLPDLFSVVYLVPLIGYGSVVLFVFVCSVDMGIKTLYCVYVHIAEIRA